MTLHTTPSPVALTLAARAASYTIRFHSGVCKGGAYTGCERLHPDGEWRAWRPWADAADALLLRIDTLNHLTPSCPPATLESTIQSFLDQAVAIGSRLPEPANAIAQPPTPGKPSVTPP